MRSSAYTCKKSEIGNHDQVVTHPPFKIHCHFDYVAPSTEKVIAVQIILLLSLTLRPSRHSSLVKLPRSVEDRIMVRYCCSGERHPRWYSPSSCVQGSWRRRIPLYPWGYTISRSYTLPSNTPSSSTCMQTGPSSTPRLNAISDEIKTTSESSIRQAGT